VAQGAAADLSPQEILSLVNNTTWAQKFELLPGIVTPGVLPVNPKAFLDRLPVPKDLSGLVALDIGSWDGAIAFELERRGARTYAMDIQDPTQTGFNVARQLLGSHVRYTQDTVYNLKGLYGSEFFDFVVFKGVYYHLKDPIRAFQAISDVLKPDGIAIVAGECLISYAETLSGEIVDPDLVKGLGDSDIPLAVSYPGRRKDPGTTCWFVPNLACIKSWLTASGLELAYHRLHHDPDAKPKPQQRFAGVARKTGGVSEEHPVLKHRWTKRIKRGDTV